MTGREKIIPTDLAARCHEIQVGLGTAQVPEFDELLVVGMGIRLALHIRGLPVIPYEVIKLVGYHFLDIPTLLTQRVVELLAEIEFVKIGKDGKTIKSVLPNVPYYEDLYQQMGAYASDNKLNEAEQLAVELVQRLAKAPQKLDLLRNSIGADNALFKRSIDVGQFGAYLRVVRARGRDILVAPTHFSENPELFADAVAGGGASQIKKIMEALRTMQGFPLALARSSKRIGNTDLSAEEINLVTRLAQDGAVRPPSITAPHSGENFFLFTPTPSGAALAPAKKPIYEKAMALVSAVRQGQFLAERIPIRRPGAILNVLRRDMKLARGTTESLQQYKNLVHLGVGYLVDSGGGYKQLQIVDTEENREALTIALALVDSGGAQGIEVDDVARSALQQEQSYLESLIATKKLQQSLKIPLTEEQNHQLELIFMK